MNSIQEVQEKLQKHALWLEDELGGTRANMSGADLVGADLSDANLTCADLSGADMSGANLSGANLGGADLVGADLSYVNMKYADMRCANLGGANMSGADMSGATGLAKNVDFLEENFEKTREGYLVLKRIGPTTYPVPEHWEIRPGAVITEVCNPSRTEECGSGVNFGTKKFCSENYKTADLWVCLLRFEDLADDEYSRKSVLECLAVGR